MTGIKLIVSFYKETVHSPNILPAFLNKARSRLKKTWLSQNKKKEKKRKLSGSIL